MPLPNYGLQPSNQCEPIHEKPGSGSKMQSYSSFTNTAGLALSGIGKRIGWLSSSLKNEEGRVIISRNQLRFSGRVIGRYARRIDTYKGD